GRHQHYIAATVASLRIAATRNSNEEKTSHLFDIKTAQDFPSKDRKLGTSDQSALHFSSDRNSSSQTDDMRLRTAQTLSIAVLAPLGMATASFGNPVNDAIAAFNNGEYSTALRLTRPLAEKGIPEAQYNLGVMFHEGKGVARNFKQAARWFCSAA